MKNAYINPQFTMVALRPTNLLVLSGGEGKKDDWGESRRFWGELPWDDAAPEEEEEL